MPSDRWGDRAADAAVHLCIFGGDINAYGDIIALSHRIKCRAAGKGFALEMVVGLLKEHSVSQAVLDFGGNLYVMGGKRDTGAGKTLPWKTALRNPDAADSIIGTVRMEDCGIATSSWYEHCFEKGGNVYHHLLNPETGYPMPLKIKSVSIISSSGMLTDLLSTAFFVLGERDGVELIRQMRKLTGEKIEYVAVLEDGRVSVSEGAGFFHTSVIR